MTTTLTRPQTIAGTPVDRVDGRLKVTGQAQYTADTPVEHLAHAVLVTSTIARGKIVGIDTTKAMQITGVLRIFTHENAPRFSQPAVDFMQGLVPQQNLMPLQDARIVHYGQQVAVVVAETFEAARAAAARVHVTYERETPVVSFNDPNAQHTQPDQFFGRPLQSERGDVDRDIAAAAIRVDSVYTTPTEFHNAMEPHATLARWEDGKLIVHEPSQWVVGLRNFLANVFELRAEDVRVVSPFVGGGFGAKGFSLPHTALAAMAARELGRPVKLVLTRPQLFAEAGNRSRTEQRLRIGATADGKLLAIDHASTVADSYAGWFIEPPGLTTTLLYACPSVRISHDAVKLNIPAAAAMRAPGETPGMFALESAIDELAAQLGIDPIELRIKNDTQQDQNANMPFSGRHLTECFRAGAERFGWGRRAPSPRAMREGNELIGFGVATATYPGMRSPASARVRVEGEKYIVEVATHDIGTGMYTIMTQVAADALGVPIEQVECRIGDSAFPPAPVAGGSMSTASVMPAVQAACIKLRETGGTVAEASTAPGDEENRYSFHSFGAQFVEVHVDEALGRVRVSRALGVFDCGRILNPKTARSQFLGGIIFGIGMALLEDGVFDHRTGRVVSDNLADYRIPVNADVGELDALFIEEPDYVFNPLGARGIGEIGITGVAAAIANAVYHATGKRVRDLPISPEKLI
jgi:xanthine dehydrogenase YagR molybdenum-binding subunit